MTPSPRGVEDALREYELRRGVVVRSVTSGKPSSDDARQQLLTAAVELAEAVSDARRTQRSVSPPQLLLREAGQ